LSLDEIIKKKRLTDFKIRNTVLKVEEKLLLFLKEIFPKLGQFLFQFELIIILNSFNKKLLF